MRRKIIALIAATALAAGPAAAQANAAQSLSLAAHARAGAETSETNEIRGGIILPTLAVAAIIALLVLTDTWPFDNDSESP